MDVVSSPLTPRRRPLAEAAKNPFVEATVAASNSNLSDIQSSTNDSSFYPTLADCRDKIDRILPNLVTLCMKTVLDSAKRSLSAVGVKTVGDFASLSKSDIEKFTWIKGRVVGARNVLMQYEKTRNAERREEIVDGSEEKPMDVADAIPPEIEAVSPSSKDSQSVPMETKDNSPPANEVIAQELPKASPISNTPSVESTQPALNVQKTPEASQSPASPISSNTGSSTFTVDPTPVQKDLSVVLSRKNLAPIFCGGLKNFKKEQLCPQKQCEKAKDAEKSFVEGKLSYIFQRDRSSIFYFQMDAFCIESVSVYQTLTHKIIGQVKIRPNFCPTSTRLQYFSRIWYKHAAPAIGMTRI